jgi:hypothetical protein
MGTDTVKSPGRRASVSPGVSRFLFKEHPYGFGFPHLKVLVDNAGGCEHAERRFRFEKVPAERIPRSALEIHGQNIVGLRTVWLAPILDLMLLLNGKDVGIVLEMPGIDRFRRKVHAFKYYSR